MLRRFYHTSAVSYNIKKQGVKLCKMLIPKSTSKKWHPSFPEANVMPSVQSLNKVKYEPNKRGIRRVAVLNKLFMKHITDLMSTGTTSLDVVGRGIEISRVNVSSDFESVNVFWVCKGNSTDDETERLLSRIAGPLRHELSTLRLMGEVPYIVFVKDRAEARLVDLNRRLAVADYGEDYTPTNLGDLLKTEFTMDTKLTPEMKAKIKHLEDSLPEEDDPIPEMSHSVFGLDHSKILNRLLAARRKSRDAWTSLEDRTVISYRGSGERTEHIDNKAQKRLLADFLKDRQIMQDKIRKRLLDTRNVQVHLDEDHDKVERAEMSELDELFDEYDEHFDEDGDGVYYEERVTGPHHVQKPGTRVND